MIRQADFLLVGVDPVAGAVGLDNGCLIGARLHQAIDLGSLAGEHLLGLLEVNPLGYAEVAGVGEAFVDRARIVEEPVSVGDVHLERRIALITRDKIVLNAGNAVDAASPSNAGGLGFPVVVVEDKPQRGSRELRAFVMLWRPRIGLRILPQPLDQANNRVDLAHNPVGRDNRLLPAPQRRDLFLGPLVAVVIVARLDHLAAFSVL
jgi:hypothetical protein